MKRTILLVSLLLFTLNRNAAARPAYDYDVLEKLSVPAPPLPPDDYHDLVNEGEKGPGEAPAAPDPLTEVSEPKLPPAPDSLTEIPESKLPAAPDPLTEVPEPKLPVEPETFAEAPPAPEPSVGLFPEPEPPAELETFAEVFPVPAPPPSPLPEPNLPPGPETFAGLPPEPEVSGEPPPPAGGRAPAEPVSVSTGAAPKKSPGIDRKLGFVFFEGLTASWLTRIIKQSGRSNFVFNDFLPGLYFGTKIANLPVLTPMIRLSAYYPLNSTFNKIPQPPKSPLHYGADLFAGADFELKMFKYIRFNLAPGLHLFFLNSERWNYLNLGAAGFLGLELPLTRGWTILINGMVSLDNGNLGGNRAMEPFDIVYQYQADIGIQYSKKSPNKYPYIKPRPQR